MLTKPLKQPVEHKLCCVGYLGISLSWCPHCCTFVFTFYFITCFWHTKLLLLLSEQLLLFFVKFACQWERWYTRNVTKAAGGLWCWQKESYCQPGCRFINKTSILFQDRRFLMWFSASSKLIGLSLCVCYVGWHLWKPGEATDTECYTFLQEGHLSSVMSHSTIPILQQNRSTAVLSLSLRCSFASFDVLDVLFHVLKSHQYEINEFYLNRLELCISSVTWQISRAASVRCSLLLLKWEKRWALYFLKCHLFISVATAAVVILIVILSSLHIGS